MATIDEIRTLLEEKAEALIARQADRLNALLHDDFVYVNAGGRTFDKASYIETYCTSGRVVFTHQVISDLTVKLIDGFVVATLSIDDELRINGRAVGGRYQSLCVFSQSAGRWLWTAGQTMASGASKVHLVSSSSRGADVNRAAPLVAAGVAMWELVERHTGQVGYEGGAKADKLQSTPPVVDCSGWTALLLATGMQAANAVAGLERFSAANLAAIDTWSDRMVEVLESWSGTILEGDHISLDTLPPYATIGLQQGGGAWATNHPRPRGITHVVQIVRHPSSDAAFVSEAQGWAEPYGLRLLPLADWLQVTQPYLRTGKAWAVDPFAMLDISKSWTA